ncbi:monoacylglycerol lipase ABHD6 isoform X1 [Equus przewalskii]|uniref:Monoacylglycerol lipase ABHD6 n=2 Tax=Equus TaxID=9789 RepID=A0A9L0TM78_HORSE|nr:monoacylglycerol lipase ABHD6 isoform X1 [Equus caballus]
MGRGPAPPFLLRPPLRHQPLRPPFRCLDRCDPLVPLLRGSGQPAARSPGTSPCRCQPALKSRMDLDVVNMFVIAGGTLAIPILAFVASFLLWPSALIRIYYWYWRRTLGMQVRYVHHEDYQFCYSFRGRPGQRPSILMLHGFSAHKDMWLSVVKFLPKNLHLICVDMPGHEGTTRSSLDDLSIDGQVKRIHQFVECLKLNKKPFHLVGTSMGGHVAGVYAAYYPSDVCSLSLVCPAGLQCSSDNQFIQRLRELQKSAAMEKIPLIPSTPEEMSEMLQLCSYVRFKVPQQLLQGLVDVRIPHNNFYRKLFLEITSEKSRYCLHQNMGKIKVPTQIIWGKQDQVLDVSGADVLAKSIANCQVELLENCGHSVVMERPRKTAKLIVDFFASLYNTDNKKLD